MGRRVLLGAMLLLAVMTAEASALNATITRTSQGIPHIKADSWEALGYGYGFAFAQDNICLMADTYTTVRAQRSRHFGADKSYAYRANGSTVNNLNSDLFYQRIIDTKVIEKLLEAKPPNGPRQEARDGVRGYVAGYNEYLRRTGVDNLPDPTCRGKAHVTPIEEIDAYRRFYQLALLASQGVAIDGIASSQPPTPATGGGGTPATTAEQIGMLDELRDRLPLGGIGSNAIALGKNATDNGRGLLLGNPHFPWDGTERFYQSHLTIPGKLDVAGGSLFGVPLVLIGHTAKLAWSHTVSTSFRFTPFEERLVPGSPTTYLYDGQPREMKRDKVTVDVGDGKKVSRTLYSTHHGPVLTSILGLPLFPWTPNTAYTMGDANAVNFRYLNHFLETNLAQSTEEYFDVLKRNQGIPWVNSIAADDQGRAFYADISVTPAVPDAKRDNCVAGPLGIAAPQLLGLPVLDGSRAACEWDVDPDAVQKGTFGPKKMPHLFRDDYVSNMNDSYWLTTPRQPLEGFARIIGAERTARALRTRSGLVMIEELLKNGGTFTTKKLQDLLYSNRQYFAELVLDDLIALCEANPNLNGVDVSKACPVLKAWDRRDNVDSRGAVLFRRFATRALAAPATGVSSNSVIFRTPFDPADPVNTPRDLNTDSSQVRNALSDAVNDLRGASIPLDAPLGQFQYELRGEEKIPIHGGPGTVGVFNALNVSWNAQKGYPDVAHGSSYIQTVRFDGDGCPESEAILTYSQSANPESRHFADQTRLYSDKKWLPIRFCAKELAQDKGRTVTQLGDPKTKRCKKVKVKRKGKKTRTVIKCTTVKKKKKAAKKKRAPAKRKRR